MAAAKVQGRSDRYSQLLRAALVHARGRFDDQINRYEELLRYRLTCALGGGSGAADSGKQIVQFSGGDTAEAEQKKLQTTAVW